MTPGGFEDKPATKHDLAEVKEELSEQIEEVKEELSEQIGVLEKKMDKGFEGLKDILKGPHGLVARLEKVEEHAGLR